jgi:hypothetical protein
MEYSEGDVVRIVSEKVGSNWNDHGQMDKWLGKTMTVRKVCSDHYKYYKMVEDIDEYGDGWMWFPYMISGLEEEEEFPIASEEEIRTLIFFGGKANV